jgi:hypothetical protein
METLVTPLFEETREESPVENESFPMKLEDHELDTLAFELWRQGCRQGWADAEDAREE